METLPLDLRRKIALNLSPKELIELCLSSKEVFYKGICQDDQFWRLKVEYDYPEVMEYFQKNNLVLKNPKNTYIRVFSKISKLIEYESRGSSGLYNFLLTVYNDLRKNMPYKDDKEFREKIYYFMEKNKNLYNFTGNKMIINKSLSDISVQSPLFTTFGRAPYLN